MESIELLKGIFEKRRIKNPAYSLSAFSRDAGMSQPQLSRIFNGTRPITLSIAKKLSVHLALDEKTESRLMESVLLSQKDSDEKLADKILTKLKKREEKKQVDLDAEKYMVIARWYHLPLFTLVTTSDFKNNPTWIAERLGISTVEAKEAIERLIEVGFIKRVDGKLLPTNNHVKLVTKNSKQAVRDHHAAMMDLARQTMMNGTDEKSFMNREISGVSIAVDPSKITAAKEKIQAFKAEMAEFMTDGNPTEVFQLNVQFFQLTKRPNNK